MKNNSYDTLSQATKHLKERGYSLSFDQKGSFLQSVEKPEIELKPEDFEIVEFHRFEGKSNPGDMSVVYAIEAKNNIKGMLIDAYGAYSDSYSSQMLEKLKIQR